MVELLRARRRTDEGASAVEYGLLIAGVAAVLVLIVFAFGGVTKNMFSSSCSSVQSKAGTAARCS